MFGCETGGSGIRGSLNLLITVTAEALVLTSLLISLAISLLLLQVAVFSTTIFLHRAATHRALILHPVVELIFRACLWITTGINTREWVAVHRKHHAFTDEEGDPHSPYLEGFWSVQLGNVFHYMREAKDKAVIEKYTRDIEDDWWERRLFRFSVMGPFVGILALSAFVGVAWALLAATVHGVLYVFVLSPSINGLCHTHGYKNFDNTATNIRLIALITGGEGLHNNHHGFPRSPKFSVSGRWSEFDPAWPVIWLLTKCQLAKPYKTIKEAELQPQDSDP